VWAGKGNFFKKRGNKEMIESIKYKEVKLTPLDEAIGTYKFICQDLAEGLDYGVLEELYNKSMEAIGSPLRISVTVSSGKFAEDFYSEFKKRGNKDA
jgi:hypothetical protein